MLLLVTGASKGIGFEIVKHFSEHPGLLTIAVSRNIKSLEQLSKKNKRHSILPLRADITKKTDILKIQNVIKSLGMPLDKVVHNAGLLVNKPFKTISQKELEAVYATNVLAPFMLTQALLPLLSKTGQGHIVTIGSMGGIQGSAKFSGLSAYSSSKAAISGLSECLAEELKPMNIAVNCLALGAVQTEMLSRAFPGYKAPLTPSEMAGYICDFTLNGQKFYNGKILPVSSTTP